MQFKIKLLFIGVSFYCVSFLGACSSSTSSIRYNSQTEDKKVSQNNFSRYSVLNTTSEDTTSYSDDVEIPESQDPGDLPDDEKDINITEIMKRIKDDASPSSESATSTKKDLVLMEIIKYINTPYKFGGNSLDGIDCSAFTQSVFKSTDLFELNRSAREQFKQGIPVTDRTELKFGDLVFFNTRRRVKPGHVGIYIGDNLFAHASSKLGVTISSLDYDYYSKRYMGARRVNTDDSF